MEKARENIEKFALGKKVTAAVSGGEDSMALLWLLHEYAKAGKLSLRVLHVCHGLRPSAEADARFVSEFCARAGIDCDCVSVDIPARCAQSGCGVECEGHFARRELFARELRAGRADLVATAHHARDNAETLLLHLFRGSGVKGLCGMRVREPSGLFRPLLYTPKENVCAFVRSNDIPFVCDETNADTDYDRNYIRHELLPIVRARFPAAEKAICRTALLMQAADEQLNASIKEEAFDERDGAVRLREEFLSAPYIVEALRRLGRESDVYLPNIESVLSLRTASPCARVDVGGGIVAAREYGAIAFYRAQPPCARTPVAYSGESGEISLPPYRLLMERVSALPPRREGTELYFDADAVPAGSVWRGRRTGDVFTPFGGGTRKLKEYLIDKKVPLRLRDACALLCNGSEVLLIAGVEISRKLAASEQSRRIFRLRTRYADGKEE